MFQDIRVFTNSGRETLTVWLEPWAHPYTVSLGQTLKVIGISMKEGSFDVSDHGNEIGVYCWAGSSVKVELDGLPQEEWPVCFNEPPPSGMALKDFILNAFGGPGRPLGP